MLKAVGYKILVKPDDIEREHEIEGTNLKLQIVQDERMAKASQVSGILVDVGPYAWKAFDKDFTGEPWAKVGDKVYYSKYAGKVITDPDTEEELLIMTDEDINCVVVKERN